MMHRKKRLPIMKSVACALAIFAVLALATTAPGSSRETSLGETS